MPPKLHLRMSYSNSRKSKAKKKIVGKAIDKTTSPLEDEENYVQFLINQAPREARGSEVKYLVLREKTNTTNLESYTL